jgi:ubiquinone biosynthesis protein
MTVAVKYGFREFLTESKLHLLSDKGEKILKEGVPGEEMGKLSRAARLRRALEELGPTFIKLGQILSTRPDILPPDWIEEFQKLQSQVPPCSWDDIHAELVSEFGDLDAHFSSIEEEPLAAASIGQAHRAIRIDGQPMVLKILRPGIEKIIKADMEILHEVAEWVYRHKVSLPFDPRDVVKEFSDSIENELDLMHEGRNTDIFRRNLEEDEQAWFPLVYWEYTTRRVLGLEEIKGVHLAHWRDAGLTKVQRQQLVRAGAYTVLRQVLEIGFFHADPHPGNLFLLDDGRLCFIDCGMAGRVDEATTSELALLIHGVATSDLEKVYTAFISLGEVDETTANVREIRRDLQDFLDQYTGVSFGQIDMSSVLMAFMEGLRKHGIKCPSDIVMMIKALTTIEGVGEELDPDFDLIAFARPHVERMIKRQYGMAAIRKRVQRNAGEWAKLLEHLPMNLGRVMDRFGRNQMSMHLDLDGIEDLNKTVHHSSRQISYSMLVAAMIMASAVLVLAAGREGEVLRWIGGFGFFLSFAMAILILLENFIRKR